MLIARVEKNPDRTHCDNCPNAPPYMIVVEGQYNDRTYPGLWLCRRCFKLLHTLTIQEGV